MNQNQSTEQKQLTSIQRQDIKKAIEEAYDRDLHLHAYYLELCLRTDSLPR